MVSMFEAMKPVFQAVGVTPREDWDTTRRQIHRVAIAQIARTNLRPETEAKWRTLGRLTQLAPPAIVYKHNKKRHVAA